MMKSTLKLTYKIQTLTFLIATLNCVRRFGLDIMKLLSKPGAIIQPFEPQFSLQGTFHGKSDLPVCSNGACEATDKAIFLLGGGGWWYEVRSVEISSATTTTTTT